MKRSSGARARSPAAAHPTPPTGTVREKEQINLTDEDSRIMPVAGGGFDQSYNAQAAVATGQSADRGQRTSPSRRTTKGSSRR